jgi:hypothetical protein
MLAVPPKANKNAGFRVCVRTKLRTKRWNEVAEIFAPEGRPKIARRFQRRGKWETKERPGGTPEVLTPGSLALRFQQFTRSVHYEMASSHSTSILRRRYAA